MRITQARTDGIHFTSDNGVTLSIGYGNYHYCDIKQFGKNEGTENMEIAIIVKGDRESPREFIPPDQVIYKSEYILPDQVMGYVPVSLLPDIMRLVQKLPKDATEKEDGAELLDAINVLIEEEENQPNE